MNEVVVDRVRFQIKDAETVVARSSGEWGSAWIMTLESMDDSTRILSFYTCVDAESKTMAELVSEPNLAWIFGESELRDLAVNILKSGVGPLIPIDLDGWTYMKWSGEMEDLGQIFSWELPAKEEKDE